MIINIFSTIIPLVSSVIIFLVGLFIFLSDRKSKTNLIFFFFTISVSIWLAGTYFLFSNCDSEGKAIFWDRFIYIGVVFIPAIIYHFSLSYSKKDRINKIPIIAAYLTALIFLFLSRTDYFLHDLFQYKWGCHAINGPLHSLFLIFFAILSFLTLYNIYKHFSTIKIEGEKKRDLSLFFALLILYLIGSFAFLPAYKIPIPPFPYIAAILTVLILAYGVIKHGLFNIRVVTAELLIFTLWLIFLVRFFMADTFQERVVEGGFLVAITIFGFMIIRSVLQEVKRREEIERISKELESVNKRLKELDRIKTEFLSFATHQIKAPLTAVKGFASLVGEGSYGAVPEKVKEVSQRIIKAVNRLVDLVNNILNLGRIESGRMEYNFEEIDFVELVSGVVDDLKMTATEKKLDLLFDVDGVEGQRKSASSPCESAIIVKADPQKLRQVIQNLIDNAIQYTQEGFVKVAITCEKENSVLFSVVDSGMGILPELLPHLFQKFVRETAPGQRIQGTGLGLYIAKEIVKAHKGEIWAESEGRGFGSQFFVRIKKITD